MSNKLEQMIKTFEEKRNAFREEAKGVFKEYCKEFFVENPEVKTIVFAAYTPYWNDGETCEYGVSGVVFTNAPKSEGIEEIYGEDVSEEYETWYGGYDNSKKYRDFNNTLKSSTMLEVIQHTFGDHVLVAIDAEGFEVVDYEHN